LYYEFLKKKQRKFTSNTNKLTKSENFVASVYYGVEHHGKFIKRIYGHRSKVQMAIKYTILGILQNIILE